MSTFGCPIMVCNDKKWFQPTSKQKGINFLICNFLSYSSLAVPGRSDINHKSSAIYVNIYFTHYNSLYRSIGKTNLSHSNFAHIWFCMSSWLDTLTIKAILKKPKSWYSHLRGLFGANWRSEEDMSQNTTLFMPIARTRQCLPGTNRVDWKYRCQ